MSSVKLLVTRPEYDIVTSYLSSWAQDALQLADKLNIRFNDLGCENVNRKEFEKRMKAMNPSFVFLNGHGTADSISGHNSEIILQTNENDSLLKNKIVYALACESASSLGLSAIDKGALSYIGYAQPFAILTDANSESVPEDDKLAQWFKEPAVQVSETILRGKSTQVAYEKSQNKYKELIRKLSSSDAFLEAKEVRFWLFWNMTSQRLLGDRDTVM